MMDSRNLWENQVEVLTRQCQFFMHQVNQFEDRTARLEARMEYFESIVIKLLSGLQSAGIIVDSDAAEESTKPHLDENLDDQDVQEFEEEVELWTTYGGD
jgi:hypothetical protein